VARDGIEPPTPAFSGLRSTGGDGGGSVEKGGMDPMHRGESQPELFRPPFISSKSRR
jgi:hypothetical protein